MPDLKLLPRNVAAVRLGAQPFDVPVLVAGNPAASLLESGVGNCFPGLECDIRNLERRFFPFLAVDTDFGSLQVTSVDSAAVAAAQAQGGLNAVDAALYGAIATDIAAGEVWQIDGLAGDFGPLGMLDFALSDLGGGSSGPGRLPADAWTAVRLLKEGAVVTLRLAGPGGRSESLAAPRMRYLDANGALAKMFEVGELSQSLCSPWTHDFRDCGCYYWATNHPDIALPPQTGTTAADNSDLATVWLRADRNASPPPLATVDGGADELRYHGINRDWQLLNLVFESRERLAPYAESEFVATPFADLATLLTQMRYAAGVELALTQEYLAAAWSLRPAAAAPAPLRPDLRAAFSEVLRIAIGEMRHLRAINEVLRALSPAGAYVPALQVAAEIPLGPGVWRARATRALTPDVIAEFVDVEAPSTSVDSLYSRILATLVARDAPDEVTQAVRTIMAEGEDHWETFRNVQQWLGRHAPAAYLRATAPAAAALPAQVELQNRYAALLDLLHQGYAAGLPAGAATINAARSAMLDPDGIEGALDAVAAAGFLPVFGPFADLRFVELGRPPDAP